ncbi:MAG: DUF294 nucleotidyltransferase-like domain-containing protein [bacterium]
MSPEGEDLHIDRVGDIEKAREEASFVDEQVEARKTETPEQILSDDELARSIIEDQERLTELRGKINQGFASGEAAQAEKSEFLERLNSYQNSVEQISSYLKDKLTQVMGKNPDELLKKMKEFCEVFPRCAGDLTQTLLAEYDKDPDNFKYGWTAHQLIFEIASTSKESQLAVFQYSKKLAKLPFLKRFDGDFKNARFWKMVNFFDKIGSLNANQLSEEEINSLAKIVFNSCTYNSAGEAEFLANHLSQITNRSLQRAIEAKFVDRNLRATDSDSLVSSSTLCKIIKEHAKSHGQRGYVERRVKQLFKTPLSLVHQKIDLAREVITNLGDSSEITPLVIDYLYEVIDQTYPGASQEEAPYERSNRADAVRHLIFLAQAHPENNDILARLQHYELRTGCDLYFVGYIKEAREEGVEIPQNVSDSVIANFKKEELKKFENGYGPSGEFERLTSLATNNAEALQMLDNFLDITRSFSKEDRKRIESGEKSLLSGVFGGILLGASRLLKGYEWSGEELLLFDRKVAEILSVLFETSQTDIYNLFPYDNREEVREVLSMPQTREVFNDNLLSVSGLVGIGQSKLLEGVLKEDSGIEVALSQVDFSPEFRRELKKILASSEVRKILAEVSDWNSSSADDYQRRIVGVIELIKDPDNQRLAGYCPLVFARYVESEGRWLAQIQAAAEIVNQDYPLGFERYFSSSDFSYLIGSQSSEFLKLLPARYEKIKANPALSDFLNSEKVAPVLLTKMSADWQLTKEQIERSATELNRPQVRSYFLSPTSFGLSGVFSRLLSGDNVGGLVETLQDERVEFLYRSWPDDETSIVAAASAGRLNPERITENVKNFLTSNSYEAAKKGLIRRLLAGGTEDINAMTATLMDRRTEALVKFSGYNVERVLESVATGHFDPEDVTSKALSYIEETHSVFNYQVAMYLIEGGKNVDQIIDICEDPKIILLYEKINNPGLIFKSLFNQDVPVESLNLDLIGDDIKSAVEYAREFNRGELSIGIVIYCSEGQRAERFKQLVDVFSQDILTQNYVTTILPTLSFSQLEKYTSEEGRKLIERALETCPPAVYLIENLSLEEFAEVLQSPLAQNYETERTVSPVPPTLEELKDEDRILDQFESYFNMLFFRPDGARLVRKLDKSLRTPRQPGASDNYNYLMMSLLGPELKGQAEEARSRMPLPTRGEQQLVHAISSEFQGEKKAANDFTEYYRQEGYNSNYLRHDREVGTEAQMLASKDVFDRRGFSFVLHGTSEASEQAISGGMAGGRMMENYGSPGFFTVFDLGQSYMQLRGGGAIVLLRDDLRNSYVNLEMSDWQGEWGVSRLSSAEQGKTSTLVRAIPRSCIALESTPENAENEITGLMLKEHEEKQTGVRTRAFEEVKKRLKASGDFERVHQTFLSLYEQMRQSDIPESEILRTVDIYMSSFLVGRLYQDGKSDKLQKVIEKIASDDSGRRIDPYIFISYIAHYDDVQTVSPYSNSQWYEKPIHGSLLDNLDPNASAEELEKQLQRYILVDQQATLEQKGWKPLFAHNRYLEEHGFPPSLRFIPENMAYILIGQKNGEDIRVARANSENVLWNIGEVRRKIAEVAIDYAIKWASQEAVKNEGRVPDRSAYCISMTSSTSRNEAVFASDYDLLLLVDDQKTQADHSVFFNLLKNALFSRFDELGYNIDAGGMHTTGFDVCLDELDEETSDSQGRFSQRVEITSMLDLKAVKEEDKPLVDRFIARALEKMKTENEALTKYVVFSGVDKFRKFFLEGSSQVMAGDPARDIKVMFTRILNFEAYHLMLRHIDKVLASGEQPPASTTDRLKFLEEAGVFSGGEFIQAEDRIKALIPEYSNMTLSEMLVVAHQDFLTWRLRSNVIYDSAHNQGIDPMSFTNVERERFNKHITVIREYLRSMSQRVQGEVRLYEAPYVVS